MSEGIQDSSIILEEWVAEMTEALDRLKSVSDNISRARKGFDGRSMMDSLIGKRPLKFICRSSQISRDIFLVCPYNPQSWPEIHRHLSETYGILSEEKAGGSCYKVRLNISEPDVNELRKIWSNAMDHFNRHSKSLQQGINKKISDLQLRGKVSKDDVWRLWKPSMSRFLTKFRSEVESLSTEAFKEVKNQ